MWAESQCQEGLPVELDENGFCGLTLCHKKGDKATDKQDFKLHNNFTGGWQVRRPKLGVSIKELIGFPGQCQEGHVEQGENGFRRIQPSAKNNLIKMLAKKNAKLKGIGTAFYVSWKYVYAYNYYCRLQQDDDESCTVVRFFQQLGEVTFD